MALVQRGGVPVSSGLGSSGSEWSGGRQWGRGKGGALSANAFSSLAGDYSFACPPLLALFLFSLLLLMLGGVSGTVASDGVMDPPPKS